MVCLKIERHKFWVTVLGYPQTSSVTWLSELVLNGRGLTESLF